VVSRLILAWFAGSARFVARFGFAFVAFVCAACHAPPRDPPSAGVSEAGLVAPSAPVASSPPASAPPTAPPPSARGACATDADCHTWSSYCGEAPCACRVLGRADAEPRCLSASKVQCLVDPCQHKLAACQSGACVLTAR
jgi:hypothetical protein